MQSTPSRKASAAADRGGRVQVPFQPSWMDTRRAAAVNRFCMAAAGFGREARDRPRHRERPDELIPPSEDRCRHGAGVGRTLPDADGKPLPAHAFELGTASLAFVRDRMRGARRKRAPAQDRGTHFLRGVGQDDLAGGAGMQVHALPLDDRVADGVRALLARQNDPFQPFPHVQGGGLAGPERDPAQAAAAPV